MESVIINNHLFERVGDFEWSCIDLSKLDTNSNEIQETACGIGRYKADALKRLRKGMEVCIIAGIADTIKGLRR